LQGGTIQEVTTNPQIICHSMGEAEYCAAALAIMVAAHLRKAFNEIKNRPSDSPLTIPIGIDSKAAANTASSAKEIKKTRHIKHRYHYFRESIQRGNNKLFHIPGVDNWSNAGLTKPETAEQLNAEAEIYHICKPDCGQKN
jgi:hypothetical protein